MMFNRCISPEEYQQILYKRFCKELEKEVEQNPREFTENYNIAQNLEQYETTFDIKCDCADDFLNPKITMEMK